METRVVVSCTDCDAHWYVEGEPARCTDSSHQHRRYELHHHRSMIAVPGGGEVMAVSFDPADPYARQDTPDYGLYFDPRWAPPWPRDLVSWPDFGVPHASDLAAALRSVLERIRGGQHVEIGCLGGHGRTGTALACLAVLTGYPRDRAVTWVRTSYCPGAVETPEQEAFVAAFRR